VLCHKMETNKIIGTKQLFLHRQAAVAQFVGCGGGRPHIIYANRAASSGLYPTGYTTRFYIISVAHGTNAWELDRANKAGTLDL
jgi:hypothetical protein